MEPDLPTWFKYRQGKADPAGDNVLKLTAPNLPEAFVAIRATGRGDYQGALRAAADGPDMAVTAGNYDSTGDAWGAAFELYRNFIVSGAARE
jgi:hypothetical protein